MADSDALRSRRKRLHAQNDHSICRHPRPFLAAVPMADPGPEFDPVAELRSLAAELHEAYRADPANSALARETRNTLLAVAGRAPEQDPELSDLFAELLSTPTNPDET